MTEAVEAEVVEVEQPKPDEQSPTTETVEETVTPTEETVEKTFSQKDVDEIVQKRVSKLERKIEREKIRAEERSKIKAETDNKTVESLKPTQDNFATYEEYFEAMADYKAEQKYAELQQREQKKTSEARNKAEQEKYSEFQADLIAVGERKYDDFEEVVANNQTPISDIAYHAILESDIRADIVYHLAKNQEVAEKISKLSPYAQAKEIGKLEDKLLAKPTPKASDAPDPLKPVGGAKANTDIDPAKMTDKQFADWRRKQIKARA